MTMSVSTAETRIEPRQPSRLEKRKNIPDKRPSHLNVSGWRHWKGASPALAKTRITAEAIQAPCRYRAADVARGTARALPRSL